MWSATPTGLESCLLGLTSFKCGFRQCGNLVKYSIQKTSQSSRTRSGSVLYEPSVVSHQSWVSRSGSILHEPSLVRADRLRGSRSGSIVQEPSLVCSHRIGVSPHIEENRSEAWLVDEFTTPFNDISVVEIGSDAEHEFAGAYILKLDGRNLVHSVYWHDQRVWTGAYYDEFAMLPALVPPGPIEVLGLGAGTVARLLMHEWPSRQLEGWEIDPEVVRVGRAYFGLAELEISRQKDFDRKGRTKHVGKKVVGGPALVVHVGDALKEDSRAEGRFAGLIVDLYSNGRICEGLKDSSTWAMLRRRLLPGGRVMVNCGGPPVADRLEDVDQEVVLETEEWRMGVDATTSALSVAFNGEINLKQLRDEGRNVMVLSGPLPSLETLCVGVPSRLMDGVQDWQQQRGSMICSD